MKFQKQEKDNILDIKKKIKKEKKEIVIKKMDQNQFETLSSKISNNKLDQFKEYTQENNEKKDKIEKKDKKEMKQKKDENQENQENQKVQFNTIDQKIQNDYKKLSNQTPIQIIEKDLSQQKLNEIKTTARKEKRKEFIKKFKKEVSSKEYDENAKTIFIGNLDKQTTIEDLKKFFQEELIEDCRLLKDKDGRSKGIAFIDFHKPEDARFAVDKNGCLFMGRNIKLDISVSKKNNNTQQN